MKIKRLGRTGLKVSEICLGTMTFGNQCDEPTSRAIMNKAFDYGVTFFDTADAYPIGGALEILGRTEEYIGNWLKGRREQIVLAQPAITSAIVGASKAEQLDQTLPAADLTLDEQLLAACDDIWYQLPRERDKELAYR
jgi:aryl-alcohol dehydrogenase-like predicted oxidoreductase